jgi:hypothetical protein
VQLLLWVAWALVALDAILVVAMAIAANSPAQDLRGRGTAFRMALAGGFILASMSGLLMFSGQQESAAAALVAIGVLLCPLVIAGAPLIEQLLNRIQDKQEAAKRGRFTNPELTAIATAIMTDNTCALTDLLRKRPDLDDRDDAGETLLAHAVETALQGQGGAGPVRALLDAGADPNQRISSNNSQILFRVFEANSPLSNELFKVLLDRDADPDIRDRFGVPMLHHAKGQLLKIKMLADSSADLNATSHSHLQYGWTPIMALAMDEAYDEALYLVQRGADVHHAAPDGATLTSVLERRRRIANESGAPLSDSYRALADAVTVHARRR